MEYTSINVYLEEHDSGESISEQVCTELKILPIHNDQRKYLVFTHDEHEELRLVESFISDYKKDLVFKASALVNNELLLKGRFNIEIDYRVVDMNTQKKKNPNKKRYKKELKKCEKRLIRTLNSLTR